MNTKFKVGDKVQLMEDFANYKKGEIFEAVPADCMNDKTVWIEGGQVLCYESIPAGKVDVNDVYNREMFVLVQSEDFELVEEKEIDSEYSLKHNHYFKECPYDKVDVYRVLDMFGVTDPCIQHATKKLLVAGGRGHKDIGRDIQDVIDTLERWKAMREEEKLKTEYIHCTLW